MGEWLWLVQWIATIVGPWAVPRLAVILLDWPFHLLCSGAAGLLAWQLTFCICPAYSGARWTHALGYACWRGFVLCAAALWVHYWLDYSGQQFIPAAVR